MRTEAHADTVPVASHRHGIARRCDTVTAMCLRDHVIPCIVVAVPMTGPVTVYRYGETSVREAVKLLQEAIDYLEVEGD